MTEKKFNEFEAENREHDIIIGRGVSFEVEQTCFKRQPGIFGIFKKRIRVTETKKYTIKEPTLAILDLISAEQIKIVVDEEKIASEIGMNEAKKLAAIHSKRMAKIIALTVLGEDYFKPIQNGSGYKYVTDDKSLEKLTMIFMSNIKPSRLVQLTLLITTIENLGDFTNSIRLMSANRTMMPIRIEAKREG